MAETPHEVGHVHLKVRDVERSEAFYADLLGLSVTERVDRFVFLTWGEHHHDVALQGIGGGTEGPDGRGDAEEPDRRGGAPGPGPGVGMYHAAFEVEDAGALRSVHERVTDAGVEVTPVDHRISKALYFDDPDGNGLEVYLDTREENDRREWRGEDRPFDPGAL